VFQFTQLAPNGDLLPFVLAAGTNQLAIYLNAQPSGDFTNPDTFSSGQLIATLQSPDVLLLQFFSEDPASTLPFVIRAIPVSRKTFTFNGTTVDFSTVAPGGLTLFNTVSTTQLPGTGIKTATNDFTLIFPFAGSGIAVGPTNAAGNVARWTRLGRTLLLPYGLAFLAEGLARHGDRAAALAASREGLEIAGATGEHMWDVELHRVTGTVLLAENKLDEGQASLQQALRIAQAQQAKSLELRAVCDLARLWGEQGRRAVARDLLAPVYGWFTEGFDTADLKDAKALLDELT
jgi:hypothetical protein